MNSSVPRWSRPLGLGESFYWQVDQGLCLNFVAYAELDAAPDAAALAQAIGALQAAHPLLRARFRVTAERVHFEAADAAPELLPINLSSRTRWWLSELSRPFPAETAPLFRCHWGRDADGHWLSLTLHHAVADGRSGLRLLGDLLGQLAGPEVRQPPPPLESEYRAEAFNAEDRIRHAGVVLGRLKQLAQQAPNPPDLPGAFAALPERRELTHRRLVLPPAALSRLTARCREHGTSVHGAVGAAYLRALHAEYFADQDGIGLVLNTPVDLRDRGVSPGGPTRMAIGAINSRLRLEHGESFWSLARRLRDDIHAQLAGGHAHLLYELVYGRAPFSAAPDAVPAMMQGLFRNPWSSMLTNVGRVTPEGTTRALGFLVAPLARQLAAIAVSSCGPLKLDVVYDPANLAPARAEGVFERLLAGLAEAAA